ncbi:MAG: hypothetical protein ACYC5Y_03255 [Symbiobacteriia bacterium]
MSARRLLAAVLLLILMLIAAGAVGVEVASHVGARQTSDMSALAAAAQGMDQSLAAWATTKAPADRQQFITAEAEVNDPSLK